MRSFLKMLLSACGPHVQCIGNAAIFVTFQTVAHNLSVGKRKNRFGNGTQDESGGQWGNDAVPTGCVTDPSCASAERESLGGLGRRSRPEKAFSVQDSARKACCSAGFDAPVQLWIRRGGQTRPGRRWARICGPAMTRTTAAQMTATPANTPGVAGSSKTRMPTVTAVSGSMTPRMEAMVEPMR